MEQKRPADIIQELLDYLWNGLGLEEKGWKRLKKGDFKKKMKNGLTYQIWFDRSRYNYIDYEIGHGNVEVGFTGIDDDIHVGAVHQVFQDTKLLFGGRRHQILPPFRQDGQICDTPLDVLGIVDVGRCKLYQMTNAPAYQIAVALQITVLTAGSTEDFCVGHSDRWLFCYN